ncbi:MAG: cation diffusion facilitator family transporter [Lachnospiraceae bacterium]|nr:cation diffusion facilitator family transporter [Lachnospiraceae bacterium]
MKKARNWKGNGPVSDYQRATNKVSVVCMAGNLALAVGKFVAGIIGHSEAMISDALHTSSDILGGLIVVIGVNISEKEADKEHPYGHERMECISSILLAFILLFAGLSVGYSSAVLIWSGEYMNQEAPGLIALVAAILSLVVKEAMFQYTNIYARKFNSSTLKAEAWHHRSDALTSIGALIGIAGARMGVRILDPLAGVVISFFILKTAFDIFKESVNRLVDHSWDADKEKIVREVAQGHEGVKSVDYLATRQFGRKVYIDLEIGVDKDKTLLESHGIAEAVHDRLEDRFPEVKHVMVHVNPV